MTSEALKKKIFLILHWANEHDHLRFCSEIVPPKWRSLFDFSPSCCAQHQTETRWSPGLNIEAGVCQTFTHAFVSGSPSWNRLMRTYRSFCPERLGDQLQEVRLWLWNNPQLSSMHWTELYSKMSVLLMRKTVFYSACLLYHIKTSVCLKQSQIKRAAHGLCVLVLIFLRFHMQTVTLLW